jgi:hypothetical protein
MQRLFMFPGRASRPTANNTVLIVSVSIVALILIVATAAVAAFVVVRKRTAKENGSKGGRQTPAPKLTGRAALNASCGKPVAQKLAREKAQIEVTEKMEEIKEIPQEEAKNTNRHHYEDVV